MKQLVWISCLFFIFLVFSSFLTRTDWDSLKFINLTQRNFRKDWSDKNYLSWMSGNIEITGKVILICLQYSITKDLMLHLILSANGNLCSFIVCRRPQQKSSNILLRQVSENSTQWKWNDRLESSRIAGDEKKAKKLRAQGSEHEVTAISCSLHAPRSMLHLPSAASHLSNIFP